MTDIWVYLIWNVVLAALLALAVASVGCLKLIRSRPALRHALWLLVLIKLITPPLIPLPVLPGGHAKPEVAAAATVNAPTEHTRDDVGQPSVSNARPEASNPANHSTGQPFSTHTARPASSESRQPASSGRWDAFSANDLVRVGWLPWLCGLWAVGTIVLSVRTAYQTLNVLRLIRRSGSDAGRLASLARNAARQMEASRRADLSNASAGIRARPASIQTGQLPTVQILVEGDTIRKTTLF